MFFGLIIKKIHPEFSKKQTDSEATVKVHIIIKDMEVVQVVAV
jgi:hypothetical protein